MTVSTPEISCGDFQLPGSSLYRISLDLKAYAGINKIPMVDGQPLHNAVPYVEHVIITYILVRIKYENDLHLRPRLSGTGLYYFDPDNLSGVKYTGLQN